MIERDPTPTATVPDPRARAMLDKLVREKGLERFAYFSVTGEGRFWRDGSEEASGNVIDSRGHVYFFWTAWDAERGAPTFRIWREQQPQERWLRSADYRRARRAVGLDA
jgi:hypothetical protein